MAVRTPVVPTGITVHIGPPEESGKNITVTFPEYIKNVASNEIYPSWPAIWTSSYLESTILSNLSIEG